MSRSMTESRVRWDTVFRHEVRHEDCGTRSGTSPDNCPPTCPARGGDSAADGKIDPIGRLGNVYGCSEDGDEGLRGKVFPGRTVPVGRIRYTARLGLLESFAALRISTLRERTFSNGCRRGPGIRDGHAGRSVLPGLVASIQFRTGLIRGGKWRRSPASRR